MPRWRARSARWSRRRSPRIGSRAPGFTHPGHTEYLAARAGVTDFAMMLAGPKLRVVLATTHVALRDVAGADRSRHHRARHRAGRARRCATSWASRSPRVAVAGLNPHAGEAGRFGDEETRLVEPAIDAGARAAGGGEASQR